MQCINQFLMMQCLLKDDNVWRDAQAGFSLLYIYLLGPSISKHCLLNLYHSLG